MLLGKANAVSQVAGSSLTLVVEGGCIYLDGFSNCNPGDAVFRISCCLEPRVCALNGTLHDGPCRRGRRWRVQTN